MAKLLSPVRTQLMYRSGTYNLWRSINGPMIPKLQNGYIVTAFDSEIALRTYLTNYKYSELIKQCSWKVGTAEITENRLEEMFKRKRPLLNAHDIWDRYMIPFNQRLSKYAGDTKSLAAGSCKWMKEVLIKKYLENDHAAILMIPLIIGFKGKDSDLEKELSEMVDKAGGEVHNNKAEQKSKQQAKQTEVTIGLPDQKIDKHVKLTPALQKIGFEVHPDMKKKK